MGHSGAHDIDDSSHVLDALIYKEYKAQTCESRISALLPPTFGATFVVVLYSSILFLVSFISIGQSSWVRDHAFCRHFESISADALLSRNGSMGSHWGNACAIRLYSSSIPKWDSSNRQVKSRMWMKCACSHNQSGDSSKSGTMARALLPTFSHLAWIPSWANPALPTSWSALKRQSFSQSLKFGYWSWTRFAAFLAKFNWHQKSAFWRQCLGMGWWRIRFELRAFIHFAKHSA